MILSVQRQVHDAIADAIRRHAGITDVPPFAVEVPPTRALGDLAVAVAFQLARTLRKAPRAIAQELAQAVGSIPGVERIVATPNGYLNLYLDRRGVSHPAHPAAGGARRRRRRENRSSSTRRSTRTRRRTSATCATRRSATRWCARCAFAARRRDPELHRRHGRPGRRHHRRLPRARTEELDEVKAIADTTRFDYYCWDLYSRVTEWYDGDRARLGVRAAALHDLERGGNDVAAMGAFIVDRIVRAHLKTMARLRSATTC